MEDIEDIIPKKSEIISASRRSDIPAFYMNYMIEHMTEGKICVQNPRNNTNSYVSLKPEDVKCFVWWSKNYSNWINKYEANKPLFNQYKHVFNFTINGYDALESGVTCSLEQRLQQLDYLAKTFGSNTIKYRFDPIVFYKNIGNDEELNNLENFELIMQSLQKSGVTNCQFAFCLPYKNVVRRMKKKGKILVELSIERQKQILDDLITICDKNGVELFSCCNSQLNGYRNKIKQSACIDKRQIENIIGSQLIKKRKDTGQRSECGCVQSRDIGSYKMNCGHSCDYCYANPK